MPSNHHNHDKVKVDYSKISTLFSDKIVQAKWDEASLPIVKSRHMNLLWPVRVDTYTPFYGYTL